MIFILSISDLKYHLHQKGQYSPGNSHLFGDNQEIKIFKIIKLRKLMLKNLLFIDTNVKLIFF